MTNTTVAKRMTKRDYFNELLTLNEVTERADLVEFIEHELELLSKKASAEKKPTPMQIANERYRELILDILSDGNKRTLSEIQVENAELAQLSNQKMNSLLLPMWKDETNPTIKRVVDKRKTYFYVD